MAEHAKELTVERHLGRRLSLISKYEDGNAYGVILSPDQAIALAGALKAMADLLIATRKAPSAARRAR